MHTCRVCKMRADINGDLYLMPEEHTTELCGMPMPMSYARGPNEVPNDCHCRKNGSKDCSLADSESSLGLKWASYPSWARN